MIVSVVKYMEIYQVYNNSGLFNGTAESLAYVSTELVAHCAAIRMNTVVLL